MLIDCTSGTPVYRRLPAGDSAFQIPTPELLTTHAQNAD